MQITSGSSAFSAPQPFFAQTPIIQWTTGTPANPFASVMLDCNYLPAGYQASQARLEFRGAFGRQQFNAAMSALGINYQLNPQNPPKLFAHVPVGNGSGAWRDIPVPFAGVDTSGSNNPGLFCYLFQMHAPADLSGFKQYGASFFIKVGTKTVQLQSFANNVPVIGIP